MNKSTVRNVSLSPAVCPSASCLCDFRRPLASLKALKGRKRSIHWPDETMRLFSRLLPSFFFYRLLCLTSLNRSLEKPFSRHTRLCVFFTKITGLSFKAAF